MKKLREQRKGEDDNVIAFEPQLATAPKPPGKDWLRDIPFGKRFTYAQKALKSPYLRWAGIASIQDECILLGTDNDFHPGHIKFEWVDSKIFSEQHRLVQVLPDQEVEEGQPPE